MPDTPQRRPMDGPPAASRPTAPTGSASETAHGGFDKERIKERAGHWADEAKHRGRSLLDQQKDGAAEQLAKLASVLHQTAEQCNQRDEERTIGRVLEQAASGLERAADAIRSKDLDSLMDQATDLMRRQPALFIGGSVLAGFVLSRFLKSSSSHARPSARWSGARRGYREGYDSAGAGIYGEAYEESMEADDARRGRADDELGGSAQSSFVTSAHVDPTEVGGGPRVGTPPPRTPTGRRDL